MASDYVLKISDLLPDWFTERLKDRLSSKGRSRHEHILSQISQTDTVLDIGCVRHSLEDISWEDPEPGEWLHGEIRQKCDNTIGIDMAEGEVEKLKKSGLEVYLANAETFDIEETFDVIVAGELIEHLSNPGMFLERCREHVSEDGAVVISTPNPRRLQMLFWYVTGNESRVNPEHTMWFDQYVIEELIKRHGFKLSEWSYYNPSISLVSTPLYLVDLFKPITAGGFVFVLEPNDGE